MRRSLTLRQRDIVDLAGRLADVFSERAARYDHENAFPFENYEDMRRADYLTLTAPKELGGGGASLLELVLAQERLAMGDGATALAVNMHLSPIGQWSSVWRESRDSDLENLLRGVVSGDVVWASLTSEAGMPNNLMDASTIAERVDGGYVIRGHKIFCTNSVAATHFSFSARYEDEAGPRLGLFRAAKDMAGFVFKETWDTLGMRATQSNDLLIEDAFVPEQALIHSLPVNHFDGRLLKTVWTWAMPTFGAVYLGVAEGAMEWAKKAAKARGRDTDPLVTASFAKMEMLLESARSVLYRHCEETMTGSAFDSFNVQEAIARCALAKVIPCNNAVEIMSHVVDVAGGAAYMRRFPLERMWRDVQAGPIMPLNNHEALRLFGATSLGVQIAPEIPVSERGLPDAVRDVDAVA